jgi:hypothetical protein
MKNIVSVELRGSGKQLTNTKVLYFILHMDPNVLFGKLEKEKI